MSDPLGGAPPPLQWHPAYADQTWLIDWLNERGKYADRHEIVLPFARRVTFTLDLAPTLVEAPRHRVLVRKRHAALAPYVGRPFVYAWNTAVDELGRAIAGEARIQLLPHTCIGHCEHSFP